MASPIGTSGSYITFNATTLKTLDVARSEDRSKVLNFIQANGLINKGANDTQAEHLEVISSRLEKRITEIKGQTDGILNFFKYLFQGRLSERSRLQSNVREMANLKEVIASVQSTQRQLPIAQPTSTPVKPPVRTPSQPTPVVPQTPETPSPDAIPVAPSLDGVPPAPSLDIPPPPPFDVPGAPPFGSPVAPSSTPSLTSAQRALVSKASPNTHFYTDTNPKDKDALEETQRQLSSDIEDLRETIELTNAYLETSNLPEAVSKLAVERRTKAEARMETKQALLDRTVERLQPNRLPLSSDDSSFREKIQKHYKNDELEIIIGMYFQGKPNPNNRADSRLVDSIRAKWETLANSESGRAFLANQADWERYLGTTNSGFIDILNRRRSGELLEPQAPAPKGTATAKKVVVIPAKSGGVFTPAAVKDQKLRATPRTVTPAAPKVTYTDLEALVQAGTLTAESVKTAAEAAGLTPGQIAQLQRAARTRKA